MRIPLWQKKSIGDLPRGWFRTGQALSCSLELSNKKQSMCAVYQIESGSDVWGKFDSSESYARSRDTRFRRKVVDGHILSTDVQRSLRAVGFKCSKIIHPRLSHPHRTPTHPQTTH